MTVRILALIQYFHVWNDSAGTASSARINLDRMSPLLRFRRFLRFWVNGFVYSSFLIKPWVFDSFLGCATGPANIKVRLDTLATLRASPHFLSPYHLINAPT